MKRRSKKKVVPKSKRISRLKGKADRALQDYYRSLHRSCVVCGELSTVMHHHVTKARSNNLRYDERNLVHLCNGCHCKHHNGEPQISHVYRNFIDEEDLLKRKDVFKSWEEEELKELIRSFQF